MYKLKVNTNVKINELIEKRIEHYWNKRSSDFSRVRRQELSSINGDEGSLDGIKEAFVSVFLH